MSNDRYTCTSAGVLRTILRDWEDHLRRNVAGPGNEMWVAMLAEWEAFKADYPRGR